MLGFECVACINHEWCVLFDERPVVTAMVSGDDDTITCTKCIRQIGDAMQAFAVDADARNMGVMECDVGALFTQEMNDVEGW